MPPRSWKLIALLLVERQHEDERERLDDERGELADLRLLLRAWRPA